MLLDGLNAIVYGAGGSLGSAVAKAFAAEGADVHLTGRRLDGVQAVAEQIAAAGGRAHVAEVDAVDASAVDEFVATVGRLDISFNLIDVQDRQGVPLVELPFADFVRPVQTAVATQFITCTAAGRAMMQQRSGVILTLTATPGGIGYPNVGGFGPACCAVEGLSRNLASELGPYGVRVVNLRSAGSPDSSGFQEIAADDDGQGTALLREMTDDTMLKALPWVNDVAEVAVFVASERASRITGVTIDVTCGTTGALNYKTGSGL